MTTKKLTSIQRLPQIKATWYTGSRIQRIWITPENEEPYRPYMLVVVDVDSGFILNNELLSIQPAAEDIEKLLFNTMRKPPEMMGLKPHRPSEIHFEDQKLMSATSPVLQEAGIRARYRPHPDILNEISRSFEEHMRGGQPPLPRLLSQPGLKPKTLEHSFAAAADFYRAAPWIQLSNSDVLAVSVLPQEEPYYIVVMGQGGVEYGILINTTWEGLMRKYEPLERIEEWVPPESTHSVTYEDITGVPFDDLDDIQRYHWEIAGPDAYPVTYIVDPDRVRRPNREELIWYEAALRAVPIFLRDHAEMSQAGQIEPAQAVIPVTTAAGQVRVEIKYPAGDIPKHVSWKEKLESFGSDETIEPHPDRRALEGDLARIARDIGGISPVDAKLREAQGIMFDAWEEKSPARRIALAYQALRISADCSDAYVLLAEEEAGTPQQALELYQKGVEAGQRALGEAYFKENKGHFWGLLETRPFMRSLEGMARCQWILGLREEAIETYREMLRLNPGDNQGIRYVLVDLYMQLNMIKDLEKLLKKYRGDYSTIWTYTEALLAFKSGGPSPEADRALEIAFAQNPYTPAYLTGRKRVPNRLPATLTMGGDTEAIDYAASHLYYWRRTPGAVEWLRSRAPEEPSKPVEPTPEQKLEASLDLLLEYAARFLEDIEQPLNDLPLRKDFLVMMTYLRDQKVTGTQSTGNLPLKAVREITSRFVAPPELDMSYGDYNYHVRNASEVWPLFFLHQLAFYGRLITGGPSRRVKVTEFGRRFLEARAHAQVFFLLVIWWNFVDWRTAYDPRYVYFETPENFLKETHQRLLGLPVEEEVDFEPFASGLVESTGLADLLKDTRLAQPFLQLIVKTMVVDTLERLGILETRYETKTDDGFEHRELETIRVTKVGRRLLEGIKIP